MGSAGDPWTEQVASAPFGPELDALIGRWLGSFVVEAGAERGFVVDGEADVVAARDMDGDDVPSAERKLPEAAVEQARERGGPWLASGGGGRGSVAGLPVEVSAGDAAPAPVLVLQNRFLADAFAAMEEQAPSLGVLASMLRIRRLEAAVAAAEEALERRQEDSRSELARSTEEILRLRRELETTREQLGPIHAYPEIVFASSAMKRMLRRLDRIVDSALPVYIHGESGTGKELVARAIHQHGPRSRSPFVAQNCSAIPKTLFESEFFGHERGAFTGAERASQGLFRRADCGTLFLDEIGDLPLDLQSKLLRVLETGEVRPVGGRQVHRVDVRIICATHRDLKELVAGGLFREDLYYRLNVVRIDVPPLRERPDDVPVLVDHFMKARIAAMSGVGSGPVTIERGVMRALIAYDWPGNVRQLENEITRAALLCDGKITLDDLSDEVRSALPAARGGAPVGGDELGRLGLHRGTLKQRVDRLELLTIKGAMERAGGNKSAVARELGLSRAGLNMKLKRLGLWDEG